MQKRQTTHKQKKLPKHNFFKKRMMMLLPILQDQDSYVDVTRVMN